MTADTCPVMSASVSFSQVIGSTYLQWSPLWRNCMSNLWHQNLSTAWLCEWWFVYSEDQSWVTLTQRILSIRCYTTVIVRVEGCWALPFCWQLSCNWGKQTVKEIPDDSKSYFLKTVDIDNTLVFYYDYHYRESHHNVSEFMWVEKTFLGCKSTLVNLLAYLSFQFTYMKLLLYDLCSSVVLWRFLVEHLLSLKWCVFVGSLITGHVKEYPTINLFIGFPRNTQSKSWCYQWKGL